jgi:leucyl aminopeptidase (aminopeptidase T)
MRMRFLTIAFGKAYPDGVEGGAQMSEDQLTALDVNQSDTHVDSW